MGDNVIEFKGRKGYRDRIVNAKWAYTTRRIPKDASWCLTERNVTPRAGDLVLAKVRRIGQHKRLELPDGRRAHLFPGDDVVVAYGNRYAPDQFEAIVPDCLGICHLVAAGGIASQMIFKHEAVKNPTDLSPVGLLTNNEGKVVNLQDFALTATQLIKNRPPVIAVVGSSMNSGKTTTAANLIRGLAQAGLTVNAGKVTGTGAGGDTWFYRDAGARRVMDFLDAGYPSTYLLSPVQVKQNFMTLLGHLAGTDPDIIVIEIADGLHQAETEKLVASKTFAHHVDGVIFAAADSLGGIYGVDRLRSWDVNILAVSGIVTRSPLGMRELQDAIDLPVLGSKVLRSPTVEVYMREWLSRFNIPRTHERVIR